MMKRILTLALTAMMAAAANALVFTDAQREALFLSDKMAHELDLTNDQYEAVFEINLDYYMSVNVAADLFGAWWTRRNADMKLVLSKWQYEKFMQLEYFYKPLLWQSDAWVFVIYTHYARTAFFFAWPPGYYTYRGGYNRLDVNIYVDRIHDKPDGPHHHHGPEPYDPHHPGGPDHHPDHPDNHPDKPDVPEHHPDNKPDKPDVPEHHPDNKPDKPDVPEHRPDNKPDKPDVPEHRPEKPEHPDRPATLPDRPERPERPATLPERPARPERPNFPGGRMPRGRRR